MDSTEPFNSSADEMLFGNILDQLASAALLDIDALESIKATIDDKLESLQSNLTSATGGGSIQETSNCSSFKNVNVIDVKDTRESACETNPIALNCFLTNIVQALKHNPGFEDSILREFLILCSKNGFLLPPVDSIMMDPQGSTVSLNTLAAEEEETRASLWQEIKQRTKSGIINKLQQSNVLSRQDFEQPGYQKEILMRLQVIDLLLAFFPQDEILQMYSNVRVEKLGVWAASTKKCSVVWADDQHSNKMRELKNLELFVVTQLDMLNMDISILWSISKSLPNFSMVQYIEKVYYSRLKNAIDKIVSCFIDNIRKSKPSEDKLQPSTSSKPASNPVSGVVNWDDVQLMSKVFAIIWNWENEVTEIISYFDEKAGESGDEDPRRSGLNSSTHSGRSTRKQERFGHIMWDEENDKSHQTAYKIRWQWREQFKKVIQPLRECISETLSKIEFILQDDDDLEAMVKVHHRITSVNNNYPSQITKKFAILVSKFDEILPMASHGGESVFQPIKEAFIEGVSSCLRECYSDLSEELDAFHDCSTLERVYKVLCSATFVCQHLKFYEEHIAINDSKPFRHIMKMYNELVMKTRSAIISCHLQKINTVVLQNPSSCNWLDDRPFQEGERCSFSVQMWSYYLRCVHSDIWSKLPLCESKKILLAITDESIVLLAGRYSKVRPSSARIKQYSYDVTVICDVCVWMMWLLADSVSDLLHPEGNEPRTSKWHSLCSGMLANVILLCSPLKVIGDHLTNGGAQVEGTGENFLQTFNFNELLLLWSEPVIFPKPVKCLSDLGDREAAFVLFKMVAGSQNPKWPLILQAISVRGALLPTIIASESDQLFQSTAPAQHESKSINENFLVPESASLIKLDLQEFVSDVYSLLLKISSKSDALAHFLMALANCENNWNLFDSNIITVPKYSFECPLWLQNIEKSLIPYLSRSFSPSLALICEADRRRCFPSFAFTNLEHLPCGCPAITDKKSLNPPSEGELLYQCLVSTLQLLVDGLNAMPRIIAVFFNRLNEYLYQRHFSAATKSPGLKIMAFISYKWLTLQENICLLFDFSISDATMGKIKCFAELVWHVLFNLTTDVTRNQSIPSEVLSYIKSNKIWLQEKLKRLTNYFKASGVHCCNSLLDQNQTLDDVAATQFSILSATLMSSSEEREALRRIDNVLQANKEKIGEKLLSTRMSNSRKVCRKTPQEDSRGKRFNPLKEYAKFGDYLHDQKRSIEVKHDWGSWMHVLSLFPAPVLRRIILARQELQPESYNYLTEDEKIGHEKLSRYFKGTPPSNVERPDSSSSERSLPEDSKATCSNESQSKKQTVPS